MGLTVATKCSSERMATLKDFSYQLVTITWRLIAEVLGLGRVGVVDCGSRQGYKVDVVMAPYERC
jgi:hypothetical protein